MHPGLSKQYLKAMGVTVWEPRSQEPELAVQTRQSATGVLPGAVNTSAMSYLSALAETPVHMSQNGQGELLLVLEPPVLTAEEITLLTNMLRAIDCDISAQSIALLSLDEAQSLRAAIPQVKPKIVVVMAAHNGNAAMLDAHRAVVHQPRWAGVPVAITMHPKELIADSANKRPAWEDLKRVKSVLGG